MISRDEAMVAAGFDVRFVLDLLLWGLSWCYTGVNDVGL